MNQTSTFDRLVSKLCQEIQGHKHKDEVMSLALAQLLDADDDHFDATVDLEIL